MSERSFTNMEFGIRTLLHSAIFFLCFSGVHNNRRKLKTNSVDESDINLDSFQLLEKYKYPSERHSVITDDGYYLNLFRIVKKGTPVLLVHGIGDSSDSWLVLGPKYSLAYMLADAGYDVWLYNCRGNKYSKGHTRNIPSEQYWNFSYDELGTHDLPAVIDYILNSTAQEKLNYVGFSQGTTAFFVLCSVKPEYNEKIKQAILLAPVAWLKHTRFPLLRIFAQNLDSVTSLTNDLRLFELFNSNFLINSYHAKVCRSDSLYRIFCSLEYYLSYGLSNLDNLPADKLPVIASHIPAGSSTKTVIHFIQGHISKKFQRFDYGKDRNLKVYSFPQPPMYNLSLITAATTLFSSKSDWISDFNDVMILKNKLPNIRNHIVLNETVDFTHIEFVYGKRIKYLVNEPVLSILINDNK